MTRTEQFLFGLAVSITAAFITDYLRRRINNA